MGRNYDQRPNSLLTRAPLDAPFDPNRYPDQMVMARILRMAETNMVPFGLLISLMQARNAPPQLRQTPRLIVDATGFDPEILIETNPQRMAFTVSNVSGAANVFFSYGYPITTQNGAFAGIQLGPGQSYQEANGTISMDDIYAWSDTAQAAILGYEGVLAIEGKHN